MFDCPHGISLLQPCRYCEGSIKVKIVIDVAGGKLEGNQRDINWKYIDSFTIELTNEQARKIKEALYYDQCEITVARTEDT
jgi:hypothetical protein